MKVLSKACVYGLRALTYMALKQDSPSFVSIREISDELEISFHFLTKTFQSLTEKGILRSYRGPSGGVAFAIPPKDIFLIDVVKIIEGEDFFDSCLLGLPGCGEAAPCPVHDFWKEVKGAMRAEFESTSLADLAIRVNADRLRIRE